MPDDPQRNELKKTLFDLRAAEFGRCFAVPSLCQNPPIRAHSLQNARTLELVAADGHVIAPTMRFDSTRPPTIDFSLIGRNKASTFLGLCSDHDQSIFQPIERRPLDLTNPQHLFLLAYRAVHFEVHATCAAAWVIQSGYRKRVELGYDPKDEPSHAGMEAVKRIAVAYDTYRYKEAFDSAYLTRRYEAIQHDLFIHEVARPTVAACVLFSLDGLWNGSDVVRVCLNVLPLEETRTAIVFSYINSDAGMVRAELSAVLNSQGVSQLYQISRRLLNHSQNFVLSPEHVATWSDSKRRTIVEYFEKTIMDNDLGYEHADLYLF